MSLQIASFRSRWRAFTDGAVTFLAILATVLVVAPLVAIFVYLIFKGARSLNVDFFTQIPKPVGEAGGGMANAIVAGSKKKLIIFPPVLYSSNVKFPTFKKTIPSTIATNSGVNNKNPFECLNKNVPIPYAINETTIPKYGVIVLAMFITS